MASDCCLMHHRSILHIAILVGVAALPCQRLAAQERPPSLSRPRADTIAIPAATTNTRLSTIDGIVTDTNLVPLRGAFISVLNSSIRVGTGPNGRFRIERVPPGQYLLIVKRGGYHPTSAMVEVPASDTVRLAYMLTQEIATLAGVTVTEKSVSFRMMEFEYRKKLGFGEFLTQEEIEQHNAVFATELFRRFKTIDVSPSRSTSTSMTEYFPLSRREGGNPTLGACPMTVYVDQVPMPSPFNLDMLPSPKNIAGIEVYAGSATIPPQFNGYNRGCGVILVWTKEGY